MNGRAAVEALTTTQNRVGASLVAPPRDTGAFTAGHSPVTRAGHWLYDACDKAFPGDITIVPLPDFGPGTATGTGSWQWGVVTFDATDGDAAWRFLAFLPRPSRSDLTTRADGAVPATRSAVALSPRYAPGGPEHLFIQQLEGGAARPRPQTPACPAISGAFSVAFARTVLDGRPVRPTPDAAVRRGVVEDLAGHQYCPTAPPTGTATPAAAP